MAGRRTHTPGGAESYDRLVRFENLRQGSPHCSSSYTPSRCARCCRWYAASPRKSWLDFARLKYRCASCSHVKPMPPWIWMLSAAARKYASEHVALARLAATETSADSSAAAHAAYWAAARADSTSSSMSAHRCLMTWKLPIGRPNW